MTEQRLDVSTLEPPEPLVRALDEAERLAPGTYLRMCHRREPCLLYGNLEARGFAHETRSGAETACEVFIWRRDDPEAEGAAREAAAERPPWQE